MKLFATLLAVILFIAFVNAQDLKLYRSVITTEGYNNDALKNITPKLSSWVTTRCTSSDKTGLATRSKNKFTVLWLSDAGAKCTIRDLQDFVISQGIYNPVATTPEIPANFSLDRCTELDQVTNITYLTCGGCKVAGCSNATIFSIIPALLIVVVAALLF
jgi:hypothetical protein